MLGGREFHAVTVSLNVKKAKAGLRFAGNEVKETIFL